MTAQEQDREVFHTRLQENYLRLPKEGALKKIRSKAWDLYHVLGLPTKEVEAFQYLKLRNFFSKPFDPIKDLGKPSFEEYIHPECRQSYIVFLNGRYAPALSNTTLFSNNVVISDLEDAATTYSAFLSHQWTKGIKDEMDPFALVNTSLHEKGIFLYITPKTQVEAPLQVLYIIDGQHQAMFTMPRLHLFLGAHSRITIASSTIQLSGKGCAVNGVADFHLEEGSELTLTQDTIKGAADTWHFEAVRAHLKRNSVFKSLLYTKGSATVRNDYRIVLAGENAEASLNGLSMLKGNLESHAHVLIEHQAPHCRSNQLFKGVLNDFSRASFEGKIYVHREAQKTEAFQLNQTLLLSDGAYAASKPNLEIFADDVKASHGSTVGQLDDDQLFYMKARGIAEQAARDLLVYGFCQELIEQCPLLSLQQELKTQLVC